VDVERRYARKAYYNARGVVGLGCNLSPRHHSKTHFRQQAEATKSIRASVFYCGKYNSNMTNNFLGINFDFDNDKFFIEHRSCSRPFENLKNEFAQRARDLFSYNKKLMLGISSGLDSQAVMHSFCSQDLKIKYAFLSMPGYNDYELENLKILSTKYSFDPIIVEMDPMALKDELLLEYQKTGMPPSHVMQAKFLKCLPDDYDFIQGIHGPDFYFSNNEWFIIESANSIELARLRALSQVNRQGKIIGWERTAEITASLLSDDVVTAFLHSYKYIVNNKLIYSSGQDIPIIDHWDLYIKPFIYGKYWKNELEYFPKYTGFENIQWIDNGPRHNYRKNLVKISVNQLMNHLLSGSKEIKKFYEH